jgi:RHS repeat-associated protein
MKVMRSFLWFMAAALILLAAEGQAQNTFCGTPNTPQREPNPDPPPALCNRECHNCTHSPCYLSSGIYSNDAADLQIKTAGAFSLEVSRHYDSSRAADGPLGVGWASNLTARLFYATYLFAAPSTYSREADIVMPDGSLYRFTVNGSGGFDPPFGRFDVLVRNADGTYTMTLQRSRSKYSFGSDGSLLSMTDDYGNAVTFTYDTAGRVQHVADTAGSGRYLDVVWDTASGRISSVTDSGGRQVRYSYDATSGTLTGISDPSIPSGSTDRSTHYAYVAGRFRPLLSQITDRFNRLISQLDWYADDKLKSYTEGTYNPPPNASAGEKYTYVYISDSNGPFTRKADSFGSRDYHYTSLGGLTGTENETFDISGQVTAFTPDVGSSINYVYGSNGQIATATQSGLVWVYTYDTTFPEKVASIIPTNQQYGYLRTDWAGWRYTYYGTTDPAPGALKEVFQVRSDTTTSDRVGAYSYDTHGRVLTQTDATGRVTTYAYDSYGNLASVRNYGGETTQYAYDSLGRVAQVTDPMGHAMTYTYDNIDRILTVTLPKPNPASTLDFTTRYAYDLDDQHGCGTGLVCTTITDPNGRVTKNGYDAVGHLVQATDALSHVTTFTYQYNLLQNITDANGNVTSYTYDPNRNLSRTDFPDGAHESYSLGLNGTPFLVTDRRGQQMQYSYDPFGRVSSVTYPGVYGVGGVTAGTLYTYRGQDQNTYTGQNLTHVTYNTPTATTDWDFTYDPSWRQLTESKVGAELITYSYTTCCGMAPPLPASYKVEHASGPSDTTQIVSYLYDAVGRVSNINWSWAGQFAFNYNQNGQYTSIAYPNGRTRTYSYDDQGRLTQVAFDAATYTYSYDYDAQMNPTMLGQRTSVGIAAAPGTNQTVGTTRYAYDAIYQLTRVDYPSFFETYTYDAIGNRTSKGNYPYTYYKNGQNTNNGQRLRNDGTGGGDLQYDANGNFTGTTLLGTFATWDFANRLASYSGTSYQYDYLGRRTGATTGSTTTRYFGVGMNTVSERATNVSNDYLFGPGIDEPLAKHAADGTISYYFADVLGSITVATDATGNVIDGFSYSAWGEKWAGGQQVFGYTGREVGGPAWFYRARYYDAPRGRFVSEDPIGEDVDSNLYRYGLNTPAMAKDPLGLFTVDPSCDCAASYSPGGRSGSGRRNGWQTIVQETAQWCQRGLSRITDPRLRECLSRSCQNGTIRCDRPCRPYPWSRPSTDTLGYSYGAPIINRVIHRRTAYICLGNSFGSDRPAGDRGDTMIHEWAHGCGWDHGGGAGVPD